MNLIVQKTVETNKIHNEKLSTVHLRGKYKYVAIVLVLWLSCTEVPSQLIVLILCHL